MSHSQRSSIMDDRSNYDGSVPVAVQAQESKRRKRRIMKIAVYFMFGIIAIGVFTIWLFHKDSVENLRFGSNFLLSVKLRSLVIKNSAGSDVLYGDMGRQLHATPYDRCWYPGGGSAVENCLQWRDTARLLVDKGDNQTGPCYALTWQSWTRDHIAEDCYYLQEYGDDPMRWFGYLTNESQSWPIENVHLSARPFYPAYPIEQVDNLVPAWFTARGSSIFLDLSYPFRVSVNETDKRQFCLMSYPVPSSEPLPAEVLRYTVCQGDNLRHAYSVGQEYRLQQDLNPGLVKPSQDMLLTKPVVSVKSRSELEQLGRQLQNNSTQCSLVQLHNTWESHFGDLRLRDADKVSVKEVIRLAKSRGCHVLLPVSTFVSYKSQYFEEGIEREFFVKDSLRLTSRMVKWQGVEGAVLDVTQPEAMLWFQQRLQRQITELGVKALKLRHVNIPQECTQQDNNTGILDYTRILYTELSLNLNVSLVLELATGFMPSPVYIPVNAAFNGVSGQGCMNTSVPHALTLGMSGYPLLIADGSWMNSDPPDEATLVTWLRLAIFFPVLRLPQMAMLERPEVRALVDRLLAVRTELVMPYIQTAWNEQPHLPILRPLFWNFPAHLALETINDQFMVGDRLMVAPLLCQQHSNRSVYLPPGLWKVNDQVLKGPRTIQVEAVLSIPYFVLQGSLAQD